MKNMFTKLIAVGLFAAFTVSTTVQAETKKEPAKESKEAGKPNGMPLRGKLSAVDQTAKTITIEGKEKSRTFHLTAETKIMKDGKAATLADAKVGDEIGGYAIKTADDKLELKSLRIGPKPEGEKKAEGEKKKKE
jgi:hypothetical protein